MQHQQRTFSNAVQCRLQQKNDYLYFKIRKSINNLLIKALNPSLQFIFSWLIMYKQSEIVRIQLFIWRLYTARIIIIIMLDLMDQEHPFGSHAKRAHRCGCYLRNPRALSLPQHVAYTVPLQHIDYKLHIINGLLNVTMIQQYQNPVDKYLSVGFHFPVQPTASIYKFVAQFADVTIEGIVKEKKEAQEEFKKAKKEGREAARGSLNSNKDTLHLEIGNIPPKAQLLVTISYLQEISISMNTFYQVRVPSTVSPSFIKDHPQNLPYTWSFMISLKTTHKTTFFDSPTHQISLVSQNQAGTESEFEMQQSQIPSNDFKFLYTTENFHLPSYVMGCTDISSTVMLSFIPKFCSLDITDAYKAQIEHKSVDTDMNVVKGDYIFLLDRSGSMGGKRIAKAKEALELFLKSLPEDSYFNVVSFGSSSQRMFPTSIKYESQQLQKAIKSVKKMQATLGGTQIYRPLQKLLTEDVIEGYPRQIFLLTDGEVQKHQEVLKMIKMKTKYCRVHGIGIGQGASFDLISGSALAGKGAYVMISDTEDPTGKIIGLLENALTPVISKINLKYDNPQDIASIIPNPESIPFILKNDPINFYITYKKPILEGDLNFTFEYTDSVTNLPYKSDIVLKQSSEHNQPLVDKMAHLKVVQALEDTDGSGQNIEDRMLYVKVHDFKKEAIEYSVKHQVLSKFTAFLCVGRQLVDGKYQEFFNKGIEEINDLSDESEQNSRSPSRSRNKFKTKTGLTQHFGGMPAGRGGGRGRGAVTNIQGIAVIRSRESHRAQPYNMAQHMDLSQPLKKEMPKSMQRLKKSSLHALKKQEQQQAECSNLMQEMSQGPSKNDQIQQYEGIFVSEVVNKQNINGSWTDPQFIKGMASRPQDVDSVAAVVGMDVAITHLVMLWLRKHFTNQKYSLIIKKAVSWLNKSIKDPSHRPLLDSIACK